jgi:DNA-directed RNA polymerase beta subunit
MVNRLLRCHLGLRPLDDRDSYVNKRLDTPGVLLANLFRQNYGRVVKDARTLIQKDINQGSWRATNKFINVIGKGNIYKVNFSLLAGSLGQKAAARPIVSGAALKAKV